MKNMRALFIMVAFLLLSSCAFAEMPDDVIPIRDADIANYQKANWRKLQKGMTQTQVRHLLGEPDHIYDDYSDSPTWQYGSDAVFIGVGPGDVKFGTAGPLWNQKKRVVIEWQEP